MSGFAPVKANIGFHVRQRQNKVIAALTAITLFCPNIQFPRIRYNFQHPRPPPHGRLCGRLCRGLCGQTYANGYMTTAAAFCISPAGGNSPFFMFRRAALCFPVLCYPFLSGKTVPPLFLCTCTNEAIIEVCTRHSFIIVGIEI